MLALSIKGRINEPAFPLGPTADNGQIFFFKSPPLHQQPKSARNIGFLRYQDQATGLAVETIHNGYLAAGSNFEREKPAQFLPQRSRAIRFRGMNEEKRRFTNDSIIVSFINDFEIEYRRRLNHSSEQ